MNLQTETVDLREIYQKAHDADFAMALPREYPILRHVRGLKAVAQASLANDPTRKALEDALRAAKEILDWINDSDATLRPSQYFRVAEVQAIIDAALAASTDLTCSTDGLPQWKCPHCGESTGVHITWRSGQRTETCIQCKKEVPQAREVEGGSEEDIVSMRPAGAGWSFEP